MRYSRYKDRETLERIKRWPLLIKRFPQVRIYSAEHIAFWRGVGNGYTELASESKVWSCECAVRITRHCGPEKRIQFIEARPRIDCEECIYTTCPKRKAPAASGANKQ